MPVYGEQYVQYGAGRCSLCRQAHPHSQWIMETSASRFKLMQLLVGLVFDEKVRQTVAFGDLQERRMFGVLVTPRRVYAAHSGHTAGGSTPYLRRAAMMGYKICAERNNQSHVHRAAGGAVIDAAMYTAAKRRYAPGNCAAPRLVGEALDEHRQHGWPIVLSGWHMSEVMYDPTVRGPEAQHLAQYRTPQGQLSRKGKEYERNMARFGDNEWTHGLSAPHCTTCDVLVPMLLCPHSGSLDDVRSRIDAGQSLGVGSRIAAFERATRRP